jgi:hypothetical protein
MNDESQVVSVTAIDSFSEDGGSDRLLQGSRVACVDGVWTFAKDGTVIPKDKRFLVLEAQQHWENGQLVEERIRKPNAAFLETIDELNAQIPQDRWEEGLNGPRPPWSLVFAVYLLDLTDGAIYTAMNSTTGMAAATRELKEKVKWIRALRGQTVNPIVTLGSQLHSKKWKKLRPSFDPVEWRNLGTTSQSPALPAPHANALPGVKVEEPSLSEEMNDELPFDLQPKATAPPPQQHRPADELEKRWSQDDKFRAEIRAAPHKDHLNEQRQAAKPAINKKGVQKIATRR